jgi:hypothetical protein
VFDIPLSGSLLRVVVSVYSSFQWSGGIFDTNLMIPSSANTCKPVSLYSQSLVVRLLLTLLQHPPKMRPTMLTGRTIAAIARGRISVLTTRPVYPELLQYDGKSSDDPC